MNNEFFNKLKNDQLVLTGIIKASILQYLNKKEEDLTADEKKRLEEVANQQYLLLLGLSIAKEVHDAVLENKNCSLQ